MEIKEVLMGQSYNFHSHIWTVDFFCFPWQSYILAILTWKITSFMKYIQCVCTIWIAGYFFTFGFFMYLILSHVFVYVRLTQQALELHKRKAVESAQTAADLKLHLDKYQAQLREAQVAVAEKTGAIEQEAYKYKRMQVC